MTQKRPTRRRATWKRRTAVWVVVCAVLGLITTVGVAWWAASKTLFLRTYTASASTEDRCWTSHIGSTRFVVERVYYEDPGSQPRLRFGIPSMGIVFNTRDLDHSDEEWGAFDFDDWLILHSDWDSEIQEMRAIHEFVIYREQAAGWPRLALWEQRIWWSGQRTWRRQNGVLATTMFPSALAARGVPVLPIWRGLLIDTAFWGAVWFILLWPTGLVAGKLKRARRRAKGKCAHCKYDLRGIESELCPECGGKRKTMPRR